MMCGFAGFLQGPKNGIGNLEVLAIKMANAISHRGPDDSGVWTDDQIGIAFGHRRLSIVDLSIAGHQPMKSVSGRYVLVFNGEIYNHLQIRMEIDKNNTSKKDSLPKIQWRGHSDTETLLAGFETWGIEDTLKKSVGMFAFALWDTHTKSLTLARDRFGEKPLYYGWVGTGSRHAFVFGSELKALRAFPEFKNEISRNSLALYMRFMYIPAPFSIYENIYKLEPGSMLTLNGAQLNSLQEVTSTPLHRRWWALSDVVEAGAQNLISDEKEAIQELEQRLLEAVRLQSLADVSIGAFLSGGVDSSAIVALMQQHANKPIKTFTVGFEEAGFDESPFALAVANHLGTEHAELFVTAVEAQQVVFQLPRIYDEPFADSSQIPTYLISQAARKSVTVALSGDGGDELFGGYNRYFWGPRIWSKLAWMPYTIRNALSAAISSIPINGWNALSRPFNSLVSNEKGVSQLGDKAHKLASRLHSVRNLDDLYFSLVSEWQDPAQVVKNRDGALFTDSQLLNNIPANSTNLYNNQNRMMYLDSMSYLPDDILCKVDRAAMAASLETRVPFLDHRVAELAWKLPINMKIRGDQGKWILREVLYKYVPKELVDRPKAGFAIPIGQWLRGPLRDWAENLLDENRLQNEGYFYPLPIRQKWKEHLNSKRDHTSALWAVLMFQAWLENTQRSV